MALVTADDLVLVTDGRYEEQAAGELAEQGVQATIEVRRTMADQRALLADLLSDVEHVGLEAEHVSWAEQRRWAGEVEGIELVATDELVEKLRLVKDEGEIARIEAACTIADEALAAVRHQLEESPTERQFALELETEMRRRGADDISFPSIVASGPNGSRPHHQPDDRVIGKGDLVTIDFGALVDGYHSDMTRTLAVGGPSTSSTRSSAACSTSSAGSQAAGVAAVRDGIDASEVDAACRRPIADAGWADAFVHGTGHGVGLDIHEGPRVSTVVGATLAPGHVVTVEPGVYLPGVGGVRVEDTVVVTEGGCRPLTRAPKD